MVYLVVSLVLLALGPLLAVAARRVRFAALALDAFVLIVLGGVVLLHILPEAIVRGGFGAAAAAIVAFVVTGLAEHGLRTRAGRPGVGRRVLLGFALLGLGMHAVVDGVALRGGGHSHAHAPASADLGGAHGHAHGDGHAHGEHAHEHEHEHDAHEHAAIAGPARPDWIVAVLVHRIPFATGLWWIVAPLLGLRIALSAFVILALGTVLGWLGGDALYAHASGTGIAVFEAVLAGTLLHVVLHADLPPEPHGAKRGEARLATLLGLIAGIAAVTAVAEHVPNEVGPVFLALALESAPALLLAFLCVGLLEAFVRPEWIVRATRGPAALEALRGVAIGIPLPICSCGVVPIYRGLVKRGASFAAGLAFLLATPELEIAAVLLTFELLGAEVAIARVVAATALAVGVALAVAALARPRLRPEAAAAPAPPVEPGISGARARLGAAFRHGFGEAIDHTAAWILVGLGVSAFLAPRLSPDVFAALPAGFDVPLAALLGLPLYVCASGSTPLAAVLVAKGLSPGAAIAFLLTGPATNLTTFGLLARLHDRRTAILFGVLVAIGATGLGLLCNVLLSGVTIPELAVFTEHGHDGTVWQWACLAVLAVAFLWSLLRLGVRGFLEPLFDTPGGGGHGHGSHGGHGGHDHAHDPHAAEAPPERTCC